jgi:hypothetical protein
MKVAAIAGNSVKAKRPHGQAKNRILPSFLIPLIAFLLIIVCSQIVIGRPSGVTIIPIRNETASANQAGMINISGGTITTINLNASTQDVRWKAFIGNVSGRMSLDDAAGATIYSWTLTSISGEVYATRYSGTINWTGVNCSNLTHISNEEVALGHTNRDDNITATFNLKNHTSFYVDVNPILNNTCRSIHTYVNSSAQNQKFDEVILYDGTNLTNGHIIYGTIIEHSIYGYNNRTYDFQMLVPERGEPSWQSATAYYFYVELS